MKAFFVDDIIIWHRATEPSLAKKNSRGFDEPGEILQSMEIEN